MNHLAHIYLSYDDPDVTLGNLYCDWLSIAAQKQLPERYLPGLRLHRWIDEYTDHHPVVVRMRRAMYPLFGKYSGVILDILMDHQLAVRWNYFSTEPYDVFCSKAFDRIAGFRHDLPEDLHIRVDDMLANRWLETFLTAEGMEITFRMLARRAKFPADFKAVMPYYTANQIEMDAGFMEFFPELAGYVRLRWPEISPQSGYSA